MMAHADHKHVDAGESECVDALMCTPVATGA